jgi:hypothetical protein
MKIALIGYTGFVGSNLLNQYEFTACYNSKNIQEIHGKDYDLCICAGVRAPKWIANEQPIKDLNDIQDLMHHLSQAEIKTMVLISTVDVYPDREDVDENTMIDDSRLVPYGFNRRLLEKWVEQHYPEHLIVRLPGLLGQGIKKNFIRDILYPMPMLFNENFMRHIKAEMRPEDYRFIEKHYPKQGVNYSFDQTDEAEVKALLDRYHISSLLFTDSEDSFQYYPLMELRKHIDLCLQDKIKIINLVTEPVQAKEVYHYLYGKNFRNELPRLKQVYDVKTMHAGVLGGKNGYLYGKAEILEIIRKFVANYKR